MLLAIPLAYKKYIGIHAFHIAFTIYRFLIIIVLFLYILHFEVEV